MATAIKNPFGITETIERVGADAEGLYLTHDHKTVLLDYIVWNATLSLLKQVPPYYSPSKLREQYGDGTNFRADRETVEDLENLLRLVMVRGGEASGPNGDYALKILPGGRWATSLVEWLTAESHNYDVPELPGDVLAATAALAMITPGGQLVLDQVRANALEAARLVHAG